MSESKCTRCNKIALTKYIAQTQASGHSMSLSPSDFRPSPPITERVCGECITDDEILLDREIGRIVAYVCGAMLKNMTERDGTLPAAIETVRTMFVVRNYDQSDESRNAVLRVLGLSKNE